MTASLPVQLPLDAIAELCRRYQVAELSVFGSVLRRDFHEKSDVDLLVSFKPEARIGLIAFSRFQRELSQAIGRKVDLVPKAGLKPLVREEVLAQARVVYAA